MTWNNYLSRFLKAIKKAGITEHILFTCSPYQHFERGVTWKALANHTIGLFKDKTLTPDQRINSFINYGL